MEPYDNPFRGFEQRYQEQEQVKREKLKSAPSQGLGLAKQLSCVLPSRKAVSWAYGQSPFPLIKPVFKILKGVPKQLLLIHD